jgi:hypothetical protein
MHQGDASHVAWRWDTFCRKLVSNFLTLITMIDKPF